MGCQAKFWDFLGFFVGRLFTTWMLWQDVLEALLEDHKFSQVCEKLGFPKNRLYAIVREGHCPNAVDAVKLCRYLGVSVEEVFGSDEKGEKAKQAVKVAVQKRRAERRRKALGKARRSG